MYQISKRAKLSFGEIAEWEFSNMSLETSQQYPSSWVWDMSTPMVNSRTRMSMAGTDREGLKLEPMDIVDWVNWVKGNWEKSTVNYVWGDWVSGKGTSELALGGWSFSVKEEGGRAFPTERLTNAQAWGSEKFTLVQEAAGLEMAGSEAGEESREWLGFIEYEGLCESS